MSRLRNLSSYWLSILVVGVACLSTYSQDTPANDTPPVLFVIDASNSMWGQIEKQAKISIARSVMRRLIAEVPDNTPMGLVAYGHRNRSDCSDVETILPLGQHAPGAIETEIDALSPKGKTPLSAAVSEAIQVVGNRKPEPVIVLLTDGLESCGGNPCQAVKTAKADDAGFKLHTIGFDLDEKQTQELQCMAEAGGGRFQSAQNAGQLFAVLQQAVSLSLPAQQSIGAAQKVTRSVQGTLPEGNPVNLSTDDSVFKDELIETASKSSTRISFRDDTVLNIGADTALTLDQFVFNDTDPSSLVINSGKGVLRMITGKMKKSAYQVNTPLATIGVRGTDFVVNSQGDDQLWVLNGQIEVTANATGDRAVVNAGQSIAVSQDGTIAERAFVLPDDDGLEIPLGRIRANAVIQSPDGSERPLFVDWQIERLDEDFIIEPVSGATKSLQLPEGEYQFIATDSRDEQLGHTQVVESRGNHEFSLSFKQPEAGVSAPVTAKISETILVEWSGPAMNGDFVSVAHLDQDTRSYVNYADTNKASPLKLLMPDIPGEYEIRYVSRSTSAILASSPIRIEDQTVTVTLDPQQDFGSNATVEWQGPNANGDYISIALSENGPSEYLNYTYTSQGSPLRLRMPDQPGRYEVRYISRQSRKILAKTDVEVRPVTVVLPEIERAAMSDTLTIEWQGPANRGDYLTIAKPESPPTKYENYTYVTKNKPAKLLMPDQGGTYELRYVSGQSRKILAKHEIVVDALVVSVDSVPESPMGRRIDVHWTGPESNRDYISIAKRDARPNEYKTYRYTREGNPVSILVPDIPGDYEIRYVSRQTRTILARTPLSVTDLSATIAAPDSAPMGSEIEVTWTGPDNERDAIALVASGESDREYGKYVYARKGSPSRLLAPDRTGSFEIRYVSHQSRRVLARHTIELIAMESSVNGPSQATIGETISVSWKGPGAKRDYLTLIDESASFKGRSQPVKGGSPMEVVVPDIPGDYELQYISYQSRKVLARQTIKVTDVGASLTVNGPAVAGKPLEISWEGPGGYRDQITLAFPDDKPNQQRRGIRVKKNPVTLRMPKQPGDYELRYVTGQKRRVLFRMPLRVD